MDPGYLPPGYLPQTVELKVNQFLEGGMGRKKEHWPEVGGRMGEGECFM